LFCVGRLGGQEPFDGRLAAAKLLPDDDLLGRVDAVNLKNVLGDIQTDRGNLHVDSSLMCKQSPYGDSSPGAGAVHHIITGHSRSAVHASYRR
jgi:hypothetical protein